MGNVVGLVAAGTIAIALMNLQTLVHLSAVAQLIAVLATAGANLIAWRRFSVPPVSAASAVKQFAFGLAVVAGLAFIDVLIGLAVGAQSVVQAFIHSGAFGGIVDGFLAMLLLLIGVPTLVRAAWLHGKQPPASAGSDA